jgi:muramoyltetrapeptide carboxypeptidase
MARPTIGIIAPSSVVPKVELKLASRRLKDQGFAVRVHPQVSRRHLFFAGTDEDRAKAFYEYATDPDIQILWAGRGGHGAIRILPWLEKLSADRGVPPCKRFVGYSDSTALLEFTRRHWGWDTIHGPMPALREFPLIREADWVPLMRLIRGEKTALSFESRKLKFYTEAPHGEIRGELVGGNLAVWVSLLGTPYAGSAHGRILFFEDVGESLYRVDRMLQQLALAGGLSEAKAIVLGDFKNCEDSAPSVLAKAPKEKALTRTLKSPRPSELKPLRPVMSRSKALREIFGAMGECYGIPVAWGVPAGHGPHYAAFPLGGEYALSPRGELRLLSWKGFRP